MVSSLLGGGGGGRGGRWWCEYVSLAVAVVVWGVGGLHSDKLTQSTELTD